MDISSRGFAEEVCLGWEVGNWHQRREGLVRQPLALDLSPRSGCATAYAYAVTLWQTWLHTEIDEPPGVEAELIRGRGLNPSTARTIATSALLDVVELEIRVPGTLDM